MSFDSIRPADHQPSTVVVAHYESLANFVSMLPLLDLDSIMNYGGALRMHPAELGDFEPEQLAQLAACCLDLGLSLAPDRTLEPGRVELVRYVWRPSGTPIVFNSLADDARREVADADARRQDADRRE